MLRASPANDTDDKHEMEAGHWMPPHVTFGFVVSIAFSPIEEKPCLARDPIVVAVVVAVAL